MTDKQRSQPTYVLLTLEPEHGLFVQNGELDKELLTNLRRRVRDLGGSAAAKDTAGFKVFKKVCVHVLLVLHRSIGLQTDLHAGVPACWAVQNAGPQPGARRLSCVCRTALACLPIPRSPKPEQQGHMEHDLPVVPCAIKSRIPPEVVLCAAAPFVAMMFTESRPY
jgi:hypothetical protein